MLRLSSFKFVFIRVHSWFNHLANPVILSRRRGFTLIELMVAVGLMGLIIAFSGVIFRYGIDAQRLSSANAEIMQKARAITEQLNSDFRGLRKDAPITIFFMQDNSNNDPNRYDQIMFFADGEFSSYQLYPDPTKFTNREPLDFNSPNQSGAQPIRGNAARIFYSLAQNLDVSEPMRIDEEKRVLARRCHILSADPNLYDWPDKDNIEGTIDDTTSGDLKNEVYEHDRVSLSNWKQLDQADYEPSTAGILDTCFNYPPLFDSREPRTFHKLLCENVSSFKIQWAYFDENRQNDEELRWFPDRDPEGDGYGIDDKDNVDDSHFTLMKSKVPCCILFDKFGVLFNIRGTGNIGEWIRPQNLYYNNTDQFDKTFFPSALKFTFTVYDSKGIIKNGRTFTHIVYLED